jgi:jumonji domain-containing protein 2
LSPQFLEQHHIPLVKVVQREREFVITYPGVYHAGFNHGLNCAESVNFATKRWIPIGARAGICECVWACGLVEGLRMIALWWGRTL